MATMSGGVKYGSMQRPTLMKQLKSILSEYPDGGQILKELIQNAEDAEATEVKILYDGRRINVKEDPEVPFTKAFKGPALCLYNDAEFSEADWKGIQMIYSSIKENDPLKVGRFGLGFKSVFHITDYPCLISGSKMLLIAPSQPVGMETAMVNISDIDVEFGASLEDFWKCFENMFGLNRECVRNGHYEGTFFRFPLRELATELSDTLYNDEKIRNLFDGLCSEASSILLFLRNLECISICACDTTQHREMLRVEIEDTEGRVKKKRSDFKQKIKATSPEYGGPDISSSDQITVKITQHDKTERMEWLVVNYFVVESASPKFKHLIRDQNLGYSPYVGIAALASQEVTNFLGHVFCFLPLPREGHSLTELPVHVNGFFALSQNRHHLKWETDEQKGKEIDDKSIQWNKFLITEALPLAYKKLIETLVEISSTNKNRPDLVLNVYNSLPKKVERDDRWQIFADRVYQLLESERLLYFEEEATWIDIADACFATFEGFPRDAEENRRNAVIQCLRHIEKKFVKIPLELFCAIKSHFPDIQDLCPDLLSEYLHAHEGYKSLEPSDKRQLLFYLLSGKNTSTVAGLELLETQSGEWKTFAKNEREVLVDTLDMIRLVPGFEDRFLMTTIQDTIPDVIKLICDRNETQIRHLTKDDSLALLRAFIEEYSASTTEVITSPDSLLTIRWLRDVWIYIVENEMLDMVRNLKIVPIFRSGNLNEEEMIALKTLNDFIVVKRLNKKVISDNVCRCLEALGATVMETLPEWIPKHSVEDYFIWPLEESILAYLSAVGRSTDSADTLSSFHSSCSIVDRKHFADFLCRLPQDTLSSDEKVIEFLKSLQIFQMNRERGDCGQLTSVREVKTYIFEADKLPQEVLYPFPCIVVSPAYVELINNLGGKRITHNDLLLNVLKQCENGAENGAVKNSDVSLVMHFVIENFQSLKNNPDIVESCRKIQFLVVEDSKSVFKASELFDPSDNHLKALLYRESLLPLTFTENSEIEVLKCFGLKSRNSIDANVLLKVSETLEKLTCDYSEDENMIITKAHALLKTLTSNPGLLQKTFHDGQILKEKLRSLSCIPALPRPLSYPKCLEWFQNKRPLCKPCDVRDESMHILVGAKMPLVTCQSEEVICAFSWKSDPDLSVVLGQLETIQQKYSIETRSDLMQSIKAVYLYLNDRVSELVKYRKMFTGRDIVCTNSGFCRPELVIIKDCPNAIDLRPYFYLLPEEFKKMERLFAELGCRSGQSLLVWQETLQMIKNNHREKKSSEEIKRDREMVVKILEAIANSEEIKSGKTGTDDILIMVQDEDQNILNLLPVSECAFDDDPTCFYEEGEQINLVHEKISQSIVESLGVKSITRKTALSAEELSAEEWGQTEPLTTRIHSLLRDGYKDGLSVPKELIQNADDAGASVVKFLYDRRSNLECRERVLSKGMKDFQGKAMWVYNDSMFSQNDLENITKLNGGTKQADVQKIGKFGLGFCSVYNLTDLPSFVTGNSVIFFDPHEMHIGSVIRNGGTGLKYKIPNRTLTSRYADQFKVYDGIFGCNILDKEFKSYNGTLFRLPLRTESQARESKIYQVSYSHEEVMKLIDMLIRSAANFLLFSQNVKTIEILCLPDDDTVTEPMLLYRVCKNSLVITEGRRSLLDSSILSRVPKLLTGQDPFQEVHETTFKQTVSENVKNLIPTLADVPQTSESVWIISWAMGQDKALEMHKSLLTEGSIPFASVACLSKAQNDLLPEKIQYAPVGFYSDGHLFCFLPLPLKNTLQVHINGCFAVTSDRRQLVTLTEDDKDNSKHKWNKVLLEDAAVKAMVNLLLRLSVEQNSLSRDVSFFDFWPVQCPEVMSAFKNEFYKRIISTNAKVFRGKKAWLPFNKVVFLEPKFCQCELGVLAFEYISQISLESGRSLIEMPDNILVEIRQNNLNMQKSIDEALMTTAQFYDIFLSRLHDEFWLGRYEERNKLIFAALQCPDATVKQLMQQIACIPTEPHQILRKPSELIHPGSDLAAMFHENDERFPFNKFNCHEALSALSALGMNVEILPEDIFIDRCKSVASVAQKCSICASERCRRIVVYMINDSVLEILETKRHIVEQVVEIYMFPVMAKPDGWKFSWMSHDQDNTIYHVQSTSTCENHDCKEKSVVLGQSSSLSHERLFEYVGLVKGVVHEDVLPEDKTKKKSLDKLLKLLQMDATPSDIPLQLLVTQTIRLVNEYRHEDQFDQMRKMHEKLFAHFNEFVEGPLVHDPAVLKELENYPVFLVGMELVPRAKVAFDVCETVRPLIYRLTDVDTKNKINIYCFLGVPNRFDVADIITAIQSLKSVWEGSSEDIRKIGALLRILENILKVTDRDYSAIREYHHELYAPDSSCTLYPTSELSLENIDLDFDVELKVLHPAIAPSTGANLGVKPKELKCFEDISMGISFGQREKLVTRIQGLLKAYPCDCSIMKELLQNADDAGASEIHFIKDYRTHPKERIFSRNCEPLQGPSLLVYNDSYFTDKDIEGIHNLGQGSKSSDPTKTGQYGVGFNAVYQLTDTPSFITVGPDQEEKSHMIVLDPLCRHVPKATALEPGQMCRIKHVKRNFPDQLSGFSSEHLLHENVGTVFRFPLRQKPSDISKDIITTETLDTLLTSFREIMFDSLLFLKNVTRITVSDITSGSLKKEYEVTVQLTDEAKQKRQGFYDKLEHITKTNKLEKEKNLDVSPFDVSYIARVTDSQGISQEWLLAQQFGLKDCKTDELKERIQDGDLGLLPLGGVAIPLPQFLSDTGDKQHSGHTNSEKSITVSRQTNIDKRGSFWRSCSFIGKAFCFLPLPINTGLPFHINGHFALDHEARQNLWKGGYREQWNTKIIAGLVVPSFISALTHFQKRISQSVSNSSSSVFISSVLQTYHALFPKCSEASSDFWKHTASEVYAQALSKIVALFPCKLDSLREDLAGVQSHKENICIHWTPVITTVDNMRGGIFNVISEENVLSRENVKIVTNILKSFGMLLLETPLWVLKELQKISSDIPRATPAFVLDFLNTWQSSSGTTCDFGPIDTHIKGTRFQKIENLVAVLTYLSQEDNFATKVEGLPIMVTGDETLKVCSSGLPAFSSRYSVLLPSSKDLFVHDTLRSLLEEKGLFKTKALKRMLIRDFAELLPLSVNEASFVDKETTLSAGSICPGLTPVKWLRLFYEFLSETAGDSVQNMRSNMELLGKWSLFPSCRINAEVVLLPLRHYPNVLYLSKLQQNDSLGKVLLKLKLPTLDTTIFKEGNLNANSVVSLLEKCVASPADPSLLLQCLCYHKKNLNSVALIGDAVQVLVFFISQIENLCEVSSESMVLNQLSQLPLFPTLQGTLTDVTDRSTVIVVPSGMPIEGMQEWASSTQTTLLEDKEVLRTLYSLLTLKNSDILEVYAKRILPNIHRLPRTYWIKHIEFLRDMSDHLTMNLYLKNNIYELLRKVDFINIGSVTKRANQLYDPCNAVFKCMKDSSEFPPKNMHTRPWNEFLKKLGMVHKVTDEDLIEFAKQIESEGRHGISSTVRNKSHQVLECFLGKSTWELHTYRTLATIKFILPFKMNGEPLKVCPQQEQGDKLICFQSAVSSSYADLCWSCVSLLPREVCDRIDQTDKSNLELSEKPPIEKVILHCQNVVDALKPMLSKQEVSDAFVENQMTSFYQYLNDYKQTSSNLIRSRLEKKPIVHLPEEKKMVLVSEVVIDLHPNDEIKPYLFRSPKCYGKYDKLFEMIGSKTQIMFAHYAAVLEKVQSDSVQTVLLPNEKEYVKKAVVAMLNIDMQNDCSAKDVQRVFLPTNKHCLKTSKDVVFPDDERLRKRLQGKIDLDFFIGVEFSGKSEVYLKDFFSKWPDHLKPTMLSDIVMETVCLDSESPGKLQYSAKAGQIEQFLHSKRLSSSLCRLLHHQFSKTKSSKRVKFDENYFQNEVPRRLQKTRVIEKEGLKTILKHCGTDIPGTEKTINWHLQVTEDAVVVLYIKDSGLNKIKIRPILAGLKKLIRTCIKEFTYSSDETIIALMQTIESEEDLSNVLDEYDIIGYGLHDDVEYDFFPKPGTYVEKDLLPFLEQGINRFEEHEYGNVAMELEDTDTGDDQVYIYVKISGEYPGPVSCNLQIKYFVQTGNPNFFTEIVPIYRLYRFVRKKSEPGKALQIYDSEPMSSKPFDDHCRRIQNDLVEAWKLPLKDRKRIIRRILLRWHPDKNPDSREYCERIFQYIQILISRLENSEEVSENIQEEISRGRSNSSQSSSVNYDSIFKRGKAYAMAYRDNYGSYARSKRRGRYSHVAESRPPHPDLGEAKRWLRQSKNDFQAAITTVEVISDVQGFNWVCYMCHQACEKALKALQYSVDANNISRGGWSHKLSYLTSDTELLEQIRLMENKLGDYAGMRYPDTQSRPKIPSDLFTQEHADVAKDVARKIIEMVEEKINQ